MVHQNIDRLKLKIFCFRSAKVLIIAVVYLLIHPAVTFAQLPTPTYGWNLGNTLEPPDGEGTWNNPPATQALIDAVADAGFNVIRIPVAWNSHANQSTYVIDSAWLARVQEVVDYCYNANLHVIINSHWDNGWLDTGIDGTVNATIDAKVDTYWRQIADTFINYDDHLLFACTNEPAADTAAEMSELLHYEQTFVNAVRSTGGGNTNRWLVVQGPNTDIALTNQLMNTLPADSTPDRLMVEVHYYTPWQFCGLTADAGWGDMFYFWGEDYHSDTLPIRNCTWGEEAELDVLFQMITDKFISQGIPVILGEFGSTRRSTASYPDLTGDNVELHLASRTFFDKYVIDSAHSGGFHPFYWDNGALDGGGLFNRYTYTVMDPESVRALTGGPALPPPGSDTTPPSVPTGLSGILVDWMVSLDWNANSEGDLNGYNVYRSDVSGSGYTKLNNSPVLDSEYTDIPPGGETYYVVTAVDTSLNESDGSDEISVTTPFTAMGTILRQWWTGIGGTAVDDLLGDTDYPDNPSGSDYLYSFEGPIDWDANYGTCIRGYLHPPSTGDYTFWIAGDDNCELWLSTDGTPDNAVLIAEVPGWTNSREWDKYAAQESDTILLTAGQKYYIEVLHKEGTGGDNIAVAWSGPGISQAVIDGGYLSPWLTGLYGDFSGNGSFSAEDLAVFAENWLSANCALTSAIDLDGNCVVDFHEFFRFAQNWMN